MAQANSRQSLKDYSLRRLGAPVIEINVDDAQIEDALDDALQFFAEYHFDGVEESYISHQVTQEDIDNKYINMDAINDRVVSVTNILSINTNNSSMFNPEYQLALSDFVGTFTPGTLTNYAITKQHMSLVQQMLDPDKNFRFSRVTNKLYGDFDWSSDLAVGDYVVIQAYVALDPNTYTEIYNDRLLKKYFTALVKRVWGNNLSKFTGIQLPGGVQFDGQRILSEAMEEVQRLEEEVQDKYELPPDFMVG
jgi:hypothetical protein